MSDRTKNLILKTLLVVWAILFFMFFPGGMIIPFLVPDQKTFDIIYNTIFFSMFGVGILFIILLLIFGGLKQTPVKAERVPVGFTSYNEFLNFLQKRLLQREYQLQKNIPISPMGEITLYLRPQKNQELTCCTIIRVPELLDELIDSANDNITEILIEYFGTEIITTPVNMISVFCVDRISPAFQKLVNSTMQQGYKNGRLVAGISFGGGKLYIANQKDGFAIARYKRLRKEFMGIMDLTQGDGSAC